MEDYAIILDYLPIGYVKEDVPSFKKKPVAQAIGIEEFTLLELIPKENVNLDIHEKVYIGAGKREKIARVNRRLKYDKLTATAKLELNYVIEEIIKEHEDRFVRFFNEAGPISTRLHQIELFKERVPMLADPVKLISKRILLELEGSSDRKGKRKYTIFTRPPKKKT